MVTTVTTTTFNMERGVGKALCQQFLWSRLMVNAVDPSNRSFRDRGLWQLDFKGSAVLLDFCQRTHMEDHPLLQHIDEDKTYGLHGSLVSYCGERIVSGYQQQQQKGPISSKETRQCRDGWKLNGQETQ
ncbi:unnamed protein product [Absidia cylindrospora]